MREVLPDFILLHPSNAELVRLLAKATYPLPPLVIWLDELQKYLEGPYCQGGSDPLTADTLEDLIMADTPVVIVGTIWPHIARHLGRVAVGVGDRTPRYPDAAAVLNMPGCYRITLLTATADERRRAARLANHDRRLALAAADDRHGLTEILAGGPALVDRWENAAEPATKAIITAAIDLRRFGVRTPLTENVLAMAAPRLSSHSDGG